MVVETRRLRHPGGACGYRLSWRGRSVAYVTDTEHPADGSLDPEVQSLMAGADVAIYDATFTDTEYAAHVGWGNSSWREGVRAAEAAAVGVRVLVPHTPSPDDAARDRMQPAGEAGGPERGSVPSGKRG